MELRRALLLFAIVLGVAAVVTLAAEPVRNGSDSTETRAPEPDRGSETPSASPRPALRTPTLRFAAQATEPRVRRIAAGRAATVEIRSERPGQVDIPGLGLTASIDPSAPTIFSILESEPKKHRVRFTAIGRQRAEPIGAIRIARAETARDR